MAQKYCLMMLCCDTGSSSLPQAFQIASHRAYCTFTVAAAARATRVCRRCSTFELLTAGDHHELLPLHTNRICGEHNACTDGQTLQKPWNVLGVPGGSACTHLTSAPQSDERPHADIVHQLCPQRPEAVHSHCLLARLLAVPAGQRIPQLVLVHRQERRIVDRECLEARKDVSCITFQ